jgi:hypothetical protein
MTAANLPELFNSLGTDQTETLSRLRGVRML